MLVNRAHRKYRKRSANLQLQDDHRDLPGAGLDGDLAFEIGGVRLVTCAKGAADSEETLL